MEITIPSHKRGLLLADNGSFIEYLTVTYSVRIHPGPRNSQKPFKIIGKIENVKKVIDDIQTVLTKPQSHRDRSTPLNDSGMYSREVEVPAKLRGIIIGTNGNTIEYLKKTYSVKIYVPDQSRPDDPIRVVGHNEECVEKAVSEIAQAVIDHKNKKYRQKPPQNHDHRGVPVAAPTSPQPPPPILSSTYYPPLPAQYKPKTA